MNLAKAKEMLLGQGVTINRKRATDEYRVNYAGGGESTAYYTNDLDDAVGTGFLMAAELKKQLATMLPLKKGESNDKG